MLTLNRLISTGLLISISLILSKIEISAFFISGGSITLFSMVPIIIISFRYGYKWGALSGCVFGFLHLLTTNIKFQGINIKSIFISILLDYIICYSIIGLSSFFKYSSNIKHNLVFGVVFSFFFKFIIHTLSGILIWSSFYNSFIAALTHSISYNALYSFPETIINLIGILLINKITPHLLEPNKF